LRSVVEEATEVLAEPARAKGLELTCEVSADLPTRVRGAGGRVRQILINLIGNAVKFTDHGEVVVRVSLPGPTQPSALQVLVEVTDTGIGIALDAQERIFSSFAQADASTTRTYGGTGLGLAISKQLVQLMGGEIGVQSTEGSGSRFWFTVGLDPVAGMGGLNERAGARAMMAEPTSALLMTSAGLRLLVVEDNDINQQVAVGMLESQGHRVDVATNGQEALEALEGACYAAVLMDCQMPVMDGYETTRAIRALAGPQHRTPIIAMTAGARATDRDRCLAAGMDDYIAKPIRLGELAAVVTRWTSGELSVGRGTSQPRTRPSDPVPADPSVALDPRMISELQALTGRNGGMSQLVEAFLSDTCAHLDELRHGIETEDPVLVRATSHRLQGSSANLGASTMAGMCAELEVAALSALHGAADILRRLEAEFERVRVELAVAFPNAPRR
ncbi:MAG: ATP-binding protein, partial [Acidimicrobiales bacterium]